jgi:NADPH2:quinone reductase
MGKTVAILGGAMYAQFRCIKAAQCLVLPTGTTAAEGASCFVNPLTALGMVATMRAEGHKALVHTAAASNLGQMLNKICLKDSVGLVNIVRKPPCATRARPPSWTT